MQAPRYSMDDRGRPAAEPRSGESTIKVEVDASGTKRWCRDGKLHREDGPAIEWVDGTKWWFRNGKRHREDGPAFEYVNCDKEWYSNGKLHREDGPALEFGGIIAWYHNDLLHREDGPAIVYENGCEEWYLHGKTVTERDHERIVLPPKLFIVVCASRRNRVLKEKHYWLPAELWGAPRGGVLCYLTESARQLEDAAHVFIFESGVLSTTQCRRCAIVAWTTAANRWLNYVLNNVLARAQRPR